MELTAAQAAMVAQAETAPIAAAYHAATKVAAAVMGPKGRASFNNAALWPLAGNDVELGKGKRRAKAAVGRARSEAIIAAVGKLAPFVRANPDAPAEALYRQAAAEGVHSEPADGFENTMPHIRLAFDTFRTVLLSVDKAMAAERAKLPKAPGAEPKPVPIEDTIFEPDEPLLAPVSYAKSFPKASPAPAKKTAAKRK